MLAFAMLATIRRKASAPQPEKALARVAKRCRIASAGQSKRSGASPTASRSAAFSQPRSSHDHSGGAPTKPPHNAPI
ncbi:hypothetical protein [Paracraurococcus ruber]|uniref:hypothetical protein n=1 Tax=Paracraurococcus ruber TaxID=77675 RepID=UPI001A920D69|nr:hypothetical protein [Paracraurococcus ruber]